ncbi:MAG TPA: AI-2E family transporter [Myxococcota bacterium]|nr:AI-2E family transporter [Myxococcota bacterium]
MRASGGLGLLLATVLVLQPFLVPMAWAAIVAYVTWPLYRAVRTRTRRPHLAAATFTLALALGLGIPLASILVSLASEATGLISALRDWLAQGAPLPAWVEARPWLAKPLANLRSESLFSPVAIAQYMARYGTAFSSRLMEIAGGIASNFFKFAIMLVTLYAFYLDGERLIAQARRLAPVVFPSAGERFLDHVGGVVRTVVFGLLGTALGQGIIAAIGFAIFGVPSAVALGALTFALSFLPVGPPLVWGGAAIWLFSQGHRQAALGMAIWGLALISTIDSVLRPVLMSSGPTRIPFLLLFLGLLGGLFAFGTLGLFLGPVLLSVAFALLADFPQRHDTSARAA